MQSSVLRCKDAVSYKQLQQLARVVDGMLGSCAPTAAEYCSFMFSCYIMHRTSAAPSDAKLKSNHLLPTPSYVSSRPHALTCSSWASYPCPVAFAASADCSQHCQKENHP